MIRFIAFRWNPSRPDEVAAAAVAAGAIARDQRHPWYRAVTWPGFALWIVDSRMTTPAAVADDPAHGYIVGRAFRRGASGTAAMTSGSLDRDLTNAAWHDGCAGFARDFWGNYLIIMQRGDVLKIARDPSGVLPCFTAAHGDLATWFSDMADMRALFALRPAIDTAYVAANCRFPKIGKAGSGLVGVDAILPASCVTIDGDGGRNITYFWHPDRFCRDPVAGHDEALTALHDSVAETVTAYLRHYRQPAISVGGLDSSIIWSLAAALGLDSAVGFTLFDGSQRGDERNYVASLAAQERMSSVAMEGKAIDADRFFDPAPSAVPAGFTDLIEMAWDRRAHDRLRDADAIVYGVGGDNVFLQGAGIYAALDHMHQRRPLGGFARVAWDSARYSKRAIGAVMARGLAARRRSGDSRSAAFDRLFGESLPGLSNAVCALDPDAVRLHPLYNGIGDLPPGKAFQLLTTCFCASDYYDAHDDAGQIERCELLLSQPIVEACLSIPSWHLAHRGIDRGLARLAFAKYLPDPVVRRMTKGTPENVYDAFVERHRDRLRTQLLDGRLQAMGIVDRDAVAALFDGDDAVALKIYAHPIVQLSSWETWCGQWS